MSASANRYDPLKTEDEQISSGVEFRDQKAQNADLIDAVNYWEGKFKDIRIENHKLEATNARLLKSLAAAMEYGALIELQDHVCRLRAALTNLLASMEYPVLQDGAPESEDAYIKRVLAMSPDEIAAEAEAVGVVASEPQSLSASLRNLRFRLEAALANRLEEGDREAISWLNDGVITLGAALAALTPSAPIADPVREALAADVLHYIHSSENGISLVPRQLLCRIKDVLRAVDPDDPAPVVPVETTS